MKTDNRGKYLRGSDTQLGEANEHTITNTHTLIYEFLVIIPYTQKIFVRLNPVEEAIKLTFKYVVLVVRPTDYQIFTRK